VTDQFRPPLVDTEGAERMATRMDHVRSDEKVIAAGLY
jgi:hypothetical protein